MIKHELTAVHAPWDVDHKIFSPLDYKIAYDLYCANQFTNISQSYLDKAAAENRWRDVLAFEFIRAKVSQTRGCFLVGLKNPKIGYTFSSKKEFLMWAVLFTLNSDGEKVKHPLVVWTQPKGGYCIIQDHPSYWEKDK